MDCKMTSPIEQERRFMYYQGFIQGMRDVLHILIDSADGSGRKIYITQETLGTAMDIIEEKMNECRDKGYLFYNSETHEFGYHEEI